ncbi:MAG: M14 family zinc carboxypeptidase [Acidobacteriota bacterium]
MSSYAADPFGILDVDAILDQGAARPERSARIELGASRGGRPIHGLLVGDGPLAVSLIAGCHADEPIGPATLDRLAAHLLAVDPTHPLRQRFTWSIVPHVNPDGEARNVGWTTRLGDPARWTATDSPTHVDLPSYLLYVRREAPGDDIEFGFPRDFGDGGAAGATDGGARPENRAVASFLRRRAREHGPFTVHGSLHGMAFAAGPWFLLERSWADRTRPLRAGLRRRVADAGYVVHDIDRGGDKGFHRLGEGFTSRPDSRAMAAHFLAQKDPETAALFRPSSMELVRALGGDPLTFVTEMPLFLVPASHFEHDPLRPPSVVALRRAGVSSEIGNTESGDDAIRRLAAEHSITPMPLRDQMRFQLLYLDACLGTVAARA